MVHYAAVLSLQKKGETKCCETILLWCDYVAIKGDIQYVWPFIIVILGLKANIASSFQIPSPFAIAIVDKCIERFC